VACGFANAPASALHGHTDDRNGSRRRGRTPPNYTTGAIKFGPAKRGRLPADRRRAAPTLGQGRKVLGDRPVGAFSTTQSFMHRSVDGGDQFNVVSPTALRPNPPPGGGDSTVATTTRVCLLWRSRGSARTARLLVSNDSGNNLEEESGLLPAVLTIFRLPARTGMARVDNGSNHRDRRGRCRGQYRLLRIPRRWDRATGSLARRDQRHGRPYGWPGLYECKAGTHPLRPTPEEATAASSSSIRSTATSTIPCQAGNHVDIITGHVNPGQRTGITFKTKSLPDSPGGSVQQSVSAALSGQRRKRLCGLERPRRPQPLLLLLEQIRASPGAALPRHLQSRSTRPLRIRTCLPGPRPGTAGKPRRCVAGQRLKHAQRQHAELATAPAAAAGFPWFGYRALIRNANTSSPLIEQDRFNGEADALWPDCNGGIGCTLFQRRPA